MKLRCQHQIIQLKTRDDNTSRKRVELNSNTLKKLFIVTGDQVMVPKLFLVKF